MNAMNCEQAKKLIDQRVQLSAAEAAGESARSSPGATDHPDWFDLDAHLAKCRKCSAAFVELLRTRKLLAGLADDAPTPRETESMWTAIQSAAACPTSSKVGDTITSAPSKRRWILHFSAATVGLAAVLMLAFVVGQFRYDQQDSYLADLLAPFQLGKGHAPSAAARTPPAPARPEKRPSSVRDSRESLRAGSHEVNGDDMALDTDALENLESLGYVGAERYTASPRPVATEQRWTFARRGVTTAKQYTSPRSSDAELGRSGERGRVAVAPDARESFETLGRVSYEYEVPRGPDKARAVEKSTSVGAKFVLRAPPEAPPLPGSGEARTHPAEYAEADASDDHVFSRAGPIRSDQTAASSAWATNSLVPLASPATKAQIAEMLEMGPDQIRTAFLNSQNALELAREKLEQARSEPVERTPDAKGGIAYQQLEVYREQVAALELQVAELDALAQEHTEGSGPPSPPEQSPGAEESSPPEPASKDDEKELPPPRPSTRPLPKIIKTGELGLEVSEYDEALRRAEAIVGQFGAFIADVRAQEQAGGAMLGRLTIRVVPEHFEALFAALKTVGRVEAENVKAADVTAQYVDLEARIRSLQITEQRLQELIKSKSFIDKIADLLEIERELTRVRSQIEQFQGQLRVMADQIALSTIAVTLREPARTVPSASMSVEVPTLDEAADALGAALEKLGGRLLSGKTAKRDDGTLKGDYNLQVSLARFGELVDAVAALGRVEQRQVKDHQLDQANAPSAERVKCDIALVLYERSRQLPAGNVAIEIDVLDAALTQLDPLVAQAGGAIVSNQTTRRDDGSNVAELKLRVPAGQFAELIASLAPLGRTTARQVAGEAGRIVGGAANVLCDLSLTLAEPVREVPSGHMTVEVAKFETARQQLSALTKEKQVQVLGSASNQRTDGTWIGAFRLGIKAADMEAVVSRLASLGRVESRQISGLGLGDLSRIDPAALGVIELTVGEKSAIAPAPDRAGESIRNRLRDALAGLYTSLGLILYGLIFLGPWLILVLAVGWLITRARRKTRPAPKPAKAS